MCDMFDDPGDLGFFDQEDAVNDGEFDLENDFDSPAPGEPGVRDNGDGTASFTGTLVGMGF